MQNEESIFAAAIGHTAPEGRTAFLDAACAGNPELRGRIEGLLWAHEHPDSFLNAPGDPSGGMQGSGPFDATIAGPTDSEPIGTVIGPYKLLQQIGEGGMGTVYMAQQTEPVQRQVALKLIKAGMDSRQIISRFEAERQALALMDHPNIARVLDAGTTGSGLPYFVMELVKGMPITKYCDAHHLTPRQRLELFIPVCQAVQHAHQKGIIHRDLKPSNVLVALYDGRPVPKVIDFGVAKATGQRLTDKTLFTGFGALVGTPEYMSPEQAEVNNQDIDTRSDIYSLGVLLYELLAGSPPFSKKELEQAGMLEMLRLIREQESSRPSTKLSTADGLPTLAANRGTEPAKLTKLVRGELDWIVMKALEKDRDRRYETANGFALDIQRYLADEHVLACPASVGYRLRKFARRNRVAFTTGAVVAAALLVAIAGTTVGLLQARAERDKALDAKEKERLALVEAEENFQTARDAVDKMYTRAAEEMADRPQLEQIRRALLEDALKFYRGFLKKKSTDRAIRYESALSQRRVGEIYGFLGELNESLENHRQAAATLAALAPQYANDVNYRDELARAHFHTGYALLNLLQLDEGAARMEQAMALWEPLTTEFPDRPSYLEDLARANVALGRALQRNYRTKGESNLTRGQELLARLNQRFPGHEISTGFRFDLKGQRAWRYSALPHDAATLQQLEQECRDQLAAAEAEARKYPDAPGYQGEVAAWVWRLGNVLAALNRPEEVVQFRMRKLEIFKQLATRHPDAPEYERGLAWSHYDAGQVLHEADRPDEALDHFRTAIRLASELVEKYPDHVRALIHLTEMIRYCPAPQLRDPQRVLELSQRVKKLGHPTPADMAVAQIDAGLYREALESCEEATRAGQHTGAIAYPAAVAYWHLGKHAEARTLARQVILQMGTQPNEYWYAPEFRRRAREVVKLMGLETEELKTSNPKQVLRDGIALYSKLAADRPADPGLQQELARQYTELSLLLSGGGQYEEAERILQEAVDTFSTLAIDEGNIPACRDNLARFHHELGVLQRQRGHLEAAEKNHRQAIAVWTKLADEVPDGAVYRVRAVNVLGGSLTPLLTASGRAAEAELAIRQAIADCEELATKFPGTEEYRRILGESYGVLGNLLVAAQRFEEAEKICSKALAKWPENAALLMARSRIYTALVQPDKALADISQAIALAPNDGAVPWWYGERANVFAALQQPDEQLAALSRAVELWPDFMDARVWRARFHFSRQEWDRALADFSKALELNPKSGPVWHERGELFARLGQWDLALIDQSKAIELGVTSPEAWLAKARAHENLGESDQALSDYARLVELKPDDADRWNRRGAAYYKLGQWDKAVADYTKAIELKPDDPAHRNTLAFAYWERGQMLQQERRWPEAVNAFRQSLGHYEQLKSAIMVAHNHWALGNALQQTGQREEAEKALRQALDCYEKAFIEFPGEIQRHSWGLNGGRASLIELLKSAGRNKEAEEVFRQAIALTEKLTAISPTLPGLRDDLATSHSNLGVLLREIGQNKEAEKADLRAIAIWEDLAADFPSVWNYRQNLAGACLRLGQHDRALAEFTKAIEIDPKATLSWWGRGVTHANLNQWDKALADHSKAVEISPNDANLWHHRAAAYIQLKQLDKALADLSQAVERSPNNWWHRSALAGVYGSLNQWDKACADYSKSLELNPTYIHTWLARAGAYVKLNQFDKAVADLREAVTNGFKDAEHLKNAPELEPLRSRDDFKNLIGELDVKN